MFWLTYLFPVVIVSSTDILSSDPPSETVTDSSPPKAGGRECEPGTAIYRECNRCVCTESGSYICTMKQCFEAELNSRERERESSVDLDHLPSLKEPCQPGQRYRQKCNICFCEKDGQPVCTGMICLDNYTIAGDISRLPVIHDNEVCTPGQTYRLNCNVCRCSSKNHLVCTKKICPSSREETKLEPSEQSHNADSDNDKTLLRTGNENGTNSDVTNHLDENKDETDENIQNTTKDINIGEENINKESGKENKIYKDLPKIKCNPGTIYSKGCQRCFCTDKKIAQCTNKPCEEMESQVEKPSDVYPRITPTEFQQLPVLQHEAAYCQSGLAYKVRCNACLCLADGSLLCDTQLCIAIDEVNRVAAFKLNGKPCKLKATRTSKDKVDREELETDCVECSCVQGKYQCEAEADCLPRRFRRQLHGDATTKAEESVEDLDATKPDYKCIPGMIYKQNCNNCFCQDNGSLLCTRKGCLKRAMVQKLKSHRQHLLRGKNN